MARTSYTPPPGWVSQAEFLAELRRLGGTASRDQLERWRGAGLLPNILQTPDYQADGRVAGSEVWQPLSGAAQAVAIGRVLANGRSLDRAGEILWTAGYEVDERYWRPTLKQADQVARLVGNWGQRLLESPLSGRTFGERIVQTQKLHGILHTAARKARQPDFARVIDMTVEVAAGEFSGFGLPASDREESEQALAERAFGFDVGAEHHIRGDRLELGADLSAILQAMSAAVPLDDFTDYEISNARDDARNALKLGHCLHAATEWIYGQGAFGLHLTTGVIRAFPVLLIQALVLGFARLRRRSNMLLPSTEIADLATQAEGFWLMSMWFHDIYKGGGEGAMIINPKRLKRALTDSDSYRDLLRELASHEFAKREFRPWDQWRKSAVRTMSPGLLAMSIGAPVTIAFDNLVESMSARAIP